METAVAISQPTPQLSRRTRTRRGRGTVAGTERVDSMKTAFRHRDGRGIRAGNPRTLTMLLGSLLAGCKVVVRRFVAGGRCS